MIAFMVGEVSRVPKKVLLWYGLLRRRVPGFPLRWGYVINSGGIVLPLRAKKIIFRVYRGCGTPQGFMKGNPRDGAPRRAPAYVRPYYKGKRAAGQQGTGAAGHRRNRAHRRTGAQAHRRTGAQAHRRTGAAGRSGAARAPPCRFLKKTNRLDAFLRAFCFVVNVSTLAYQQSGKERL